MAQVLISWIGTHDLEAAERSGEPGRGPISAALLALELEQVVLLSDWARERAESYVRWASTQTSAAIRLVPVSLSSPTAMDEVYTAARSTLNDVQREFAGDIELTFHISPGTSVMASVWILIAKAEIPAKLVQASKEAGVQEVDVPFEIDAIYLPGLQREGRVKHLAAGAPPTHPAFDEIVFESQVMADVIERAQRVAQSSVPVLIEGPSGTGKELLARAIHEGSDRSGMPFVPVNCGALSKELAESELFGHRKGAFTGAIRDHPGFFRKAHGSTIFLDEVGELETDVQVKLLRVLQESKVRPVGDTTESPVDVRIVAATNRSLTREVAEGRFREDLFFRLAVAVLELPALRNRGSDLRRLIDELMSRVNAELATQYNSYTPKSLTTGARRLLLSHSWPGNIRELQNALTRAALWVDADSISKSEMEQALRAVTLNSSGDLLSRPLGDSFEIMSILDEVRDHFVLRAWNEANQVKTRAAKLLGLVNYQTYSNWLEKAQKRRR